MSKKIRSSKSTSKSSASTPQVLDDARSAAVLGEYLVLGEVAESELSFLDPAARTEPLTNRQIALTFRVSKVLGLPDPFVLSPRFRDLFATVRGGEDPAPVFTEHAGLVAGLRDAAARIEAGNLEDGLTIARELVKARREVTA